VLEGNPRRHRKKGFGGRGDMDRRAKQKEGDAGRKRGLATPKKTKRGGEKKEDHPGGLTSQPGARIKERGAPYQNEDKSLHRGGHPRGSKSLMQKQEAVGPEKKATDLGRKDHCEKTGGGGGGETGFVLGGKWELQDEENRPRKKDRGPPVKRCK